MVVPNRCYHANGDDTARSRCIAGKWAHLKRGQGRLPAHKRECLHFVSERERE